LVTPGIRFTDEPIFAAPLPLANSPISFSFTDIPVFRSSGARTWSVRDADMDAIGKTMATQIDSAVSPRIAGRLLSSVNQSHDLQAQLPAVRKALQQILECKATLADILSKRLSAAYSTETRFKDEIKADVIHDFKQRLMRRLKAYFDIDVAISYQTHWPTQSQDKLAAPHLYYSVEKPSANSARKRSAASKVPDYTLDQAPLPIQASHAFTVFMDISPAKDLPSNDPPQFGTNLTFRRTYVQRMRYPLDDSRSVEGRQTQWLRLIQPGTPDYQQATIEKVPVIVRELPKPPTIIEQTARNGTV
jgi:hypothetical protein